MSGAEVISLISAIITVIDFAKKAADQLKDANNLPEAFRQVNDRLPILVNTLKTIEDNLSNDDVYQDQYREMMEIIAKSQDKADDLREILESVAAADDDSKLQRYRKVIRRLGKESRVEELTKEIGEDIRVLAQFKAVSMGASAQEQLDSLLEALKELAAVESSMPDSASSSLYNSHTGSGHINNQYGPGDFYAASGQAKQTMNNFSGATFSNATFGGD